MIISSCGLRRSGSTWLFNLIRLGYESLNTEIESCFSNKFQLRPDKIQLVKCHEFRLNVAECMNYCFISRRDLRDVASSAIRRKLINPTSYDVLKFLENEINSFKLWMDFEPYIVDYADILNNKNLVAQNIFRILDINPNLNDVFCKLELLTPTSTYDHVSKLWPDHITDGKIGSYKQTLPTKLINIIEKRFYN